MATYTDLCSAYFDWQPTSLAIDENVRQSPTKTLDGLRRYLSVPPEYVNLYSSLPGSGQPWNVCANHEDALLQDKDGTSAFTIGVMMARQFENVQNWPITSNLILFSFRIEDVGPEYISLRIRNSSYTIRINHPREDNAYSSVSENIIDYVIRTLRERVATTNAPISIGFI